jgi:hypothetical protein
MAIIHIPIEHFLLELFLNLQVQVSRLLLSATSNFNSYFPRVDQTNPGNYFAFSPKFFWHD